MYKDLANYNLDLNAATPDWRVRLMRVLIKDVLILIALVAMAEIILRLFFPGTSTLIYTENLTGGHPVIYNEYGLRDIDFPLQKPDGEKRILALGNSTTFGSGVAMEDTWPKKLQKELGEPWFVINGGGQGSSLPQIELFMDQYGYAMQPDEIILGFSPAMIARTKITGVSSALSWSQKLRGSLIAVHKEMHSSYAYSAFDHYVRQNLYRMGVLEDNLGTLQGAIYAYAFDARGVDMQRVKNDYQEFFNQLAAFKSKLDKRGIKLRIVGFPSRFELSDRAENNPRNYPLQKIRIHPLDQMHDFAKAQNIPFLNLSTALEEKEDIFIEGDYSHLNIMGHKDVAQSIAKARE
jgi:hypothetical protein